MRSGSFGNRHVIRFESGEQVMDSLRAFLDRERIGFSFLSAAGGVRQSRLSYLDAGTKEYVHREFDEQLEVLSFQGNSSRKEGGPHVHVHAVLGRPDFTCVGGHVEECVAHPTLELWIEAVPVEVERVKDPASGLDLLDLPPASA